MENIDDIFPRGVDCPTSIFYHLFEDFESKSNGFENFSNCFRYAQVNASSFGKLVLDFSTKSSTF